jgi:Predicted metal-binding integral membrane protein (DUF2182)
MTMPKSRSGASAFMLSRTDLLRPARSGCRTLRILSEGREARIILLLVAVAWIALVFPHRSGVWIEMCLGTALDESDGPSRMFLELGETDFRPVWHLFAMTIAMMAPLGLLYPVAMRNRIAENWRVPAFGAFLLAYLSVWIIFAFAVDQSRKTILASGADPRVFLVAVSLLAILWQASAWRRRIAGRHHRLLPLPAAGWRVCGVTGQRGLSKAGLCLASCGPMMLIPLFAGHQVGVMFIVAILGLVDRTSFRPLTTHIQIGLASAGLIGVLMLG